MRPLLGNIGREVLAPHNPIGGRQEKPARPVRIENVRVIGREELKPGDISVDTVDSPHRYEPNADVTRWDDVIYRPSTGELFRLPCHDSANSGYTSADSGVEPGKLPPDVILIK